MKTKSDQRHLNMTKINFVMLINGGPIGIYSRIDSYQRLGQRRLATICVVLFLGTLNTLAHAQANNVTLYGIADGGITYTNNQGGASSTQATSGGLGSSRWGLTGVENLGGGMSTIFKLESGFNLQTGQLLQNGRGFGRLAYVGLNSQWGTLTLGRQDDVMGDYLGAYSGSVQFSGPLGTHAGDLDNIFISYKLSNTVKYASPSLGGFSFGGLYGVGGVSGSVGTNQLWGMAAHYAGGPFSASAVYHHINDPTVTYFDGAATASSNTPFSNPVNNPIYLGYSSAASLDAFGVGAGLTIGASTIGVNLTSTQFNRVVKTATTPRGGASPSITSVEVAYSARIIAAAVVGISYAYTHADAAKYSQVTLGTQYFLSKRTRLYAEAAWQHASGIDSTGRAAVADLTTVSASSSGNQIAARVGISVRF
ncbi:porin [Caballeronia sordidicola]|nr:porin [Caballeronia sordidicola]